MFVAEYINVLEHNRQIDALWRLKFIELQLPVKSIILKVLLTTDDICNNDDLKSIVTNNYINLQSRLFFS